MVQGLDGSLVTTCATRCGCECILAELRRPLTLACQLSTVTPSLHGLPVRTSARKIADAQLHQHARISSCVERLTALSSDTLAGAATLNDAAIRCPHKRPCSPSGSLDRTCNTATRQPTPNPSPPPPVAAARSEYQGETLHGHDALSVAGLLSGSGCHCPNSRRASRQSPRAPIPSWLVP
jgi:hypothetical protein